MILIRSSACAMALILAACTMTSVRAGLAPVVTPSSLATKQGELERMIREGEGGDVDAMRYLVLYYTQESSDEASAYRWMFAAAEAGDESMRRSILAALDQSDDPVSRGIRDHLRRKWACGLQMPLSGTPNSPGQRCGE